MNLDETQLLARFRQGFDLSSSQVLTLNKPVTKVDESKPWVRFSVSLGERDNATIGDDPIRLQLGGVYLQVFIPKALGLKGGDELVEKFDNLFCDWRSADGAIQIGRMSPSMIEQPTYYQRTIRFAFESLRKRS